MKTYTDSDITPKESFDDKRGLIIFASIEEAIEVLNLYKEYRAEILVGDHHIIVNAEGISLGKQG
jgi:hypothetical protein